ncbi:hypothetical protein [Microbacterium sp. UCD-TDU]|uniref:hypothetical protein n=1 Tax=Microbacterium sp. UCD-TDU TaxID=1247714 RepID=UPI0003466B36|nr:hypothetical protein [Microbacterium sp. UCD-TDU]EYT60917.1 hypothetical protein D514_0106280 [Microbacterium sp. UCD-TDU]
MVVGRKRNLARAVDLIQAGISIDVVGGRGSGRTAFLGALRKRLEDSDWRIVTVRGIASLRHHPLAALHLSGIGKGSRTSAGLEETADALQSKLRHPRSALFLDDWDDLDESSWGIAESIRRATGIPVVISRLQGLRARHTPSGLVASTQESSYVIDMTPLDFENLELAISAHLNGPVEASTMSRIYAKSGGNIGLAISLVDATVRENLLVRRGSEWVAARDLWSSGMRAVLEGYLENLDKSTRDALEIIAIVGVAGLETVRKLVEWDTLELLEERSLIAFVNRGPSQLITVTPPLLVEYFRHEPLSTRQIRLTELIIDRLGSSSSSTATILTERSNSLHTATEPDALFVRLLHERARARRIVMAAEWEANATPATAVRYVAALMDTYTPAADTDIRRVIGSTDLLSGGDRRPRAIAIPSRSLERVRRSRPRGGAADTRRRQRRPGPIQQDSRCGRSRDTALDRSASRRLRGDARSHG